MHETNEHDGVHCVTIASRLPGLVFEPWRSTVCQHIPSIFKGDKRKVKDSDKDPIVLYSCSAFVVMNLSLLNR
jgi:hypothetical protein